MNVLSKILRKITKLRLHPIRVLCFHNVSEVYNPLTTWECDWTQIDQFKKSIKEIKRQGYTFISLTEAYEKLKHDWVRCEKYVVLTADDGYKSILNILPWLDEQQIPVTVFINTKYLDGKSWSAINEEQARRAKPDVDMLTEVCPDLYISKKELFALTSSYLEIGMHGHEHEHLDATKQNPDEFRMNVEQCRDVLKQHPRYVPFFAYAWGRHNRETDEMLTKMGLVPLLVNGMLNYTFTGYINRQAIDGKTIGEYLL